MRGSSQQGLQHAFDRFSAACNQAGMKISTKTIEVLCLSRRLRQCILQVNGNTLQQVETFKYLPVVFAVTEVGTKRLIHGLVKQTQFCVSFIVPWWLNGSLQRLQSFQFLNPSMFRSSPVVMNVRWRLKEYCQKNKLLIWNICEEFSVWHFVTKSTGLKFGKPGMLSHFSE